MKDQDVIITKSPFEVREEGLNEMCEAKEDWILMQAALDEPEETRTLAEGIEIAPMNLPTDIHPSKAKNQSEIWPTMPILQWLNKYRLKAPLILTIILTLGRIG